MKIIHIVKTTYSSTNLSVFVRVSEEKPTYTQAKAREQASKQVGRNIGGLYNVYYLHLCLIYCFMRKTSTHIGCL